MTAAPPAGPREGEWMLEETASQETQATRSFWRGFVACAQRGHSYAEGQHRHGVSDWRKCLRCGLRWRRDGCLARRCGERRDDDA